MWGKSRFAFWNSLEPWSKRFQNSSEAPQRQLFNVLWKQESLQAPALISFWLFLATGGNRSSVCCASCHGCSHAFRWESAGQDSWIIFCGTYAMWGTPMGGRSRFAPTPPKRALTHLRIDRLVWVVWVSTSAALCFSTHVHWEMGTEQGRPRLSFTSHTFYERTSYIHNPSADTYSESPIKLNYPPLSIFPHCKHCWSERQWQRKFRKPAPLMQPWPWAADRQTWYVRTRGALPHANN